MDEEFELRDFFPSEETGTFMVCHRCREKVLKSKCDWCGGSGRTFSDEKCSGCA